MHGQVDVGVKVVGRLRALPMAWRLPIPQLLALAPRLAAAIAAWHENAGPHGALCPGAIRLDDADHVHLAPPGPIEAAYRAPEQRGTLRLPIDERCDLYAIGVLLHRLATGRLPGDGDDRPRCTSAPPKPSSGSPRQLAPDLPQMMEKIILRLLAALPHERYQSAAGLASDLQRCHDGVVAGGRAAPLVVGGRDVAGRLRLHGGVYGRERALAKLVSIVERVRTTGASEFVMVTGKEGLGKTTLIDAFANHVVLAGGRVIGGRSTSGAIMPFEAIAGFVEDLDQQASRGVWHGVATLDEQLGTAIRQCSAAFSDPPTATGDPGSPACVPMDNGPAAAIQRLHLGVRRMLAAAARPGAPLIVTIDDFHLADSASVTLIAEMVGHPAIGHLVVVAGCAPSLPAGHPVNALVKQSQRAGTFTAIPLRPLSDTAVTGLIGDALGTPRAESAKLARQTVAVTGSAPVVVAQYLHRLRDDGALTFDPRGPRWWWRPTEPGAAHSVADLPGIVRERLGRMTPDARMLVEAAAVLGTTHQVATAIRVADLSRDGGLRAFAEVIQAGWFVAVATRSRQADDEPYSYMWMAERLRNVLLSTLDADEVLRLRAMSGRVLNSSGGSMAGYAFFTMVDHRNAAVHLLSTESERVNLAELNLSAARRAGRCGAVEAASHYGRAGLNLLTRDHWTSHYAVALGLHAEAAHIEYARGDNDVAERILSAAQRAAANEVDQAWLHWVRAHAARRRGDHEACLKSTLAALALLHPHVPAVNARRSPTVASTADALMRRVRTRLNQRRADALAEAPTTDEHRVALAAHIAVDPLSPLEAGTESATVLAALAVQFALGYGPTSASSLAFASLAISAVQRYDDEATARRCLLTALRLLRRYPDAEMAVRVLPAVAFVLPVWLDDPGHAQHLLQEAYLTAIELGQIGCAQAHEALHYAHRLLAGDVLDSIAQQVASAQALLDRQEPEEAVRMANRHVRHALDRLRTLPAGPTTAVRPEAVLPVAGEAGVDTSYVAVFCLTVDLMAACVLGDRADSARLADVLVPMLAATPPNALGFVGAEAWFYVGLAVAVTGNTVEPKADHPVRTELETVRDRLDGWAARSPGLFAHKALLITAEHAWISGDHPTARRRYDEAISEARTAGLVHVEAIAAERAAAHAAAQGHTSQALAYLRRARVCFYRWNAHVKVDQLDRAGRDLGSGPHDAVEIDHLDLLALGNALEMLSAEVDPDKVADRVAELFLQHTGADRACLLLCDSDEPRVVAVASRGDGPVRSVRPTHRDEPLDTHVPLTIVDHVRATRQPFVADRQNLPRDPYLSRNQPEALLCAPLTRSDRLVAIVYVENRQPPPSMPPGHQDLLRILSLHAATALHHATTHAQLLEAAEALDATFDRLPTGLILLGPDFAVRRASQAVSEMTGLLIRPGTPVAELFDVLTPADAGAPPYTLELALAVAGGGREPVHRMISIIQASGPPIRLRTSAVPLRRADGRLLGLALLVAEAIGEES